MTTNTPALPSASTELAAIRDALAELMTPIGNMTDTHTRILRSLERQNAYQQAVLPHYITAVLAYVDALQAENQALRADAARLDFMCSKSPLRFIEGNNDMWRVYQDEAPPEAFAHKWRAIVTMYYPTAREAIDAAVSASGEGGQS